MLNISKIITFKEQKKLISKGMGNMTIIIFIGLIYYDSPISRKKPSCEMW